MVEFSDVPNYRTHLKEQYRVHFKTILLFNCNMYLNLKERTINGFKASLKAKEANHCLRFASYDLLLAMEIRMVL